MHNPLRRFSKPSPALRLDSLGGGVATIVKNRLNARYSFPSPPIMLRALYRSVWLPAAVTTVLLLLALTLLLGVSWRSLTRLEPVHHHLAAITRLQETGLRLEEALIQSLSTDTPLDATTLAELRAQVASITGLDSHLVPETRRRLLNVGTSLDNPALPTRALLAGLEQIRQVTTAELRAHDHLLLAVQSDSRTELGIAAAAMFGFPLLALLTLYFLRRRIWVPLKDLGALMTSLTQQDYSTVPIENADPLLIPLFAHYNSMVLRLAELERRHQSRQQFLEKEVHAATRTLLEHQRDLANAERLAAMGEVAAGVAHELRNPLAGIQMALANLRNDLSDRDQAERLDLVIKELQRVTRLLNDLLNQSHQAPEPAVDLCLADSVETLLSLARYQVPDTVRLHQTIPSELRCRLPEGRLRQALLNLILNAVQNLDDGSGIVTVSATLENGVVHLRVEDDGSGFPPMLLHNGVRAFGSWRDDGTGLGLATVRRFAQDLGGTLHLTNRTPRGACVTLELPCG